MLCEPEAALDTAPERHPHRRRCAMYYSSGNYEAFARPRKPERAERASAWIIGTGLAGLSAAVFLIRDAQVPGDRIHLLEELPLAGGSLDGVKRPDVGFITRGGREMENHFECLWDMYRSIPSLEAEGASYLDEYYWLDKDDPNSSNCRLIHNRGERVADDGDFTLSEASQKEIVGLFLMSEESVGARTIDDYFSEEFFESNFWAYWATMFAFERWHSLAEMRRYLLRFVHHINGLPDFTALKFNKYNQYESMVKPLLAYLKDHGVDIRYGTAARDVRVSTDAGKKTATALLVTVDGEDMRIRRMEHEGGQTYIVDASVAAAAGNPVRIRHVYRTVTPAWGHRIYVELPQPARGFSFDLDYTNTSIDSVSVTDMAANGRAAQIVPSPKRAAGRSLSLRAPGWLLSKSGFAVVWTLEDELPQSERSEAA